jgi:opacity protein-like surface antigen
MYLKPYLGPTLAALFLCAASPVLAQVVPAATQGNIPLSVGGGISAFNPDDGKGHILGGTLWIDYTLPHMPHNLHGIGIEAEGRDLNYGRSGSLLPGVRQDVALGGVIYSCPRYRDFRPYGKFLMGYGNADEETTVVTPPAHWTDSRTVTSMGGGMDYRVLEHLWVRVDYEYQSWPDFFKHPPRGIPPVVPPAQRLKPQGFTVGVMYHFSHRH